nr:hypothetical protein [uncultured Faecalimonas sp.]
MNRDRSLSVVAPCSHVTETRVIWMADTIRILPDHMNQGGTT